MRQASNLPPGMRERDIPGNSLRDEIWDRFVEDELEPLKSRVQDIITENDPENPVVKQLVGMWHELYGDTLP